MTSSTPTRDELLARVAQLEQELAAARSAVVQPDRQALRRQTGRHLAVPTSTAASQAAHGQGQPADVVAWSVEQIVRFTGSEFGFLGLIDERETTMSASLFSTRTLEICAMDSRPVEFDLSRAGLWAEAVRQHRAVAVNDYALPHPGKKGLPSGHVPVRRFLVVPVMRGPRAVLVAGLANKQDDYDEWDEQSVGLFLEGVWELMGKQRAEETLREAKEQLAKTNQLLTGVLEHTHMLAAFLDPRFNFIWVNRAYAKNSRQEESFFPGKNHFDLYPHPENQVIFQRVVETGEPYFVEAKPFTYPDQPERGVTYWDWSLSPVKDGQGTVSGLVLTLADVTHRILAEERLRQSEANFRALIELGQDVFVRYGLDLRYRYVSPTLRTFLGKGPEDTLGQTHRESGFSEEQSRFFDDALHQVIASKASIDVEFAATTHHGRELIMHSHVFPELDSRGEVTSVITVTRDITAQKRAEALTQETFRRLQLALRSGHLGVWDWDLQSDQMIWDEEMLRLYGLTPEQVPSGLSAWRQALHPEDLQRGLAAFQAAIDGVREYNTEFRIRRPDGTVRHVKADGLVLRDERGAARRMLGLNRDVTPQRQAQEELARRDAELRAAQAIGRVGSWTYDVAADRFTWTEETFRIFGRDPARGEPSWSGHREHMMPEDWERVDQAVRVAMTNRCAYREEVRTVRGDGQSGWVEVIGEARRDSAGRVVEHLGTVQDITLRKAGEEERVRLEEQLRQAQKMEAVGQLAGGVAHDFNNVLGAITLQLNMLQLQPDISPGELQEVVAEMLEAANRAAGVTRQLLLFSRRQTMRMARHDVNEILRGLAKLLRRLLDERVTLAVKLSDEPLWIEGDAGMIEQVVTNLCVNARDAMPVGGRVTLTTRTTVLDLDATRRHDDVQPGRFVCLEISDTGCGIDPAALEHIFEPFFTTKPHGKGTGLGLATVHGIVAKHRGFLEVNSEVGSGSTFTVFLPSAAPAGADRPEHLSVGMQGGTESVLVVEDEAPVRRMAVRCLRRLGYRVTEAADGVEALSAWDREGGTIDLLFTDMVMPGGLSGLELCSRLRQRRPGLRTIIASGYSAEIVDADDVTARHVRYLCKPYDMAGLAAAVRECLESEG